jgi:hypothetical protein
MEYLLLIYSREDGWAELTPAQQEQGMAAYFAFEEAGYFLIDAPDLDAALAWAARCPGASHGTVEVRPVWPALP